MSKFTEGPWQCEWKSVYSDKAEVIIAHVHDNKDCAIISKAPEMLELLKDYQNQAYEGKGSWNYSDFLSRLDGIIKEIEGE